MNLQHSSGYGGLENTPLARPGYHSNIIARYYERDFIPEITNSEFDGRVTHCHQQVQIMMAPEVGEWRSYEANQEIIPNQVTAEAICLNICNAAYNAIKIDKTTVHFACENWKPWEERFLDSVYEKLVAMLRKWVLTSMVVQTSPRNRGPKAGQFANIDLGSRGNPVVVNRNNFNLRMAQLQQVLVEQLHWTNNEMFVLVPVALRPILATSSYADSGWVGSCKACSYGIDGMWDLPIMGFNVIETIHLPYVVEPDGRVCFYVIAGHRNAFAFVSDIIDGEIVKDSRTFGLVYRMLAVWGGKMIYPESMAVAYWTFQNI